jgi:hypothetical protein
LAFITLRNEFEANYSNERKQFIEFLEETMVSFKSTSAIKEKWGQEVLSGWKSLVSNSREFLETQSETIAKKYDKWIVEELKFSVDIEIKKWLKNRFKSIDFYVPIIIYLVLFGSLTAFICFFQIGQSALVIIGFAVGLILVIWFAWNEYDAAAKELPRKQKSIPQLNLQFHQFEKFNYRHDMSGVASQGDMVTKEAIKSSTFFGIRGAMTGDLQTTLLFGVIGGILGGILGWLFGKSLKEIKREVLDETLTALYLQLDELLKLAFIKQAEANFKTASANAVKLLMEKI